MRPGQQGGEHEPDAFAGTRRGEGEHVRRAVVAQVVKFAVRILPGTDVHALAFADQARGFDLFAGLAAELLEQSTRLCRLLSDSYPIVILDEFQDTNMDEWRMIRALGKQSRIITLADAEQRIYEFSAGPHQVLAVVQEEQQLFGLQEGRQAVQQ